MEGFRFTDNRQKKDFINDSETAEPQTIAPHRRKEGAARSFYVWMSVFCLTLAVIGFAPTYWLQLPAATFNGSPMLHLHGILFTGWNIYLIVQTMLTARGRLARHRAFGLFGISLATAMVFVGFAVANTTLIHRLEAGYGDAARSFQIASISMITLFGIFVFLGIWYAARLEIHKRLMLLATISALPPPISRLFFAVKVGIGEGLRPGILPPRSIDGVLLPTLLADALILVCIAYDLRTRGKPHPVYLIGGSFMVFVHLIRGPTSTTHWWYQAADWLASFSI